MNRHPLTLEGIIRWQLPQGVKRCIIEAEQKDDKNELIMPLSR
jgi:hypothetical protein